MSFPRYRAYKNSGVEWLGEVPKHWGLARARRVFEQKRVQALSTDEQLSATQRYGVVPQRLFMEREEQKVTLALGGTGNFKHVEQGDFVISLRSFQGGIEYSAYSGCVSPAYTVLRARDAVHDRYWAYAFKSAGFIAELQSVTDGIRDGKNVSYEQFGSLTLPLVPVGEQRAIAGFLDVEMLIIDALITEQQRLIRLLREKQQVVISQAVTRGLCADLPMKESGVDRMGEVPGHWQVVALKRLVNLASGDAITADLIEPSGGYPVYGGNGVRGYTSEFNRDGEYALVGRQGALCGNVNYASGKFWASEHALVATPTRPLNTVWLGEALRTMNLNQYSVSAAQPGLSVEVLKNLKIAVPPLSEQDEIAAACSRESVRTNQLVCEAERAVTLLNERRSAMISAAVTGKIDVRSILRPKAA